MRNTVFGTIVPLGQTYRPGIGRRLHSHRPDAISTDDYIRSWRTQKFTSFDHPITLRFQANFYNIFNTLNLIPFVNGNAGGAAQIVNDLPDTSGTPPASSRAISNFGKSTGADAGRVVEFYAKINF